MVLAVALAPVVLAHAYRGALPAFQSDYGLAITSAVDRPTLQTLGAT